MDTNLSNLQDATVGARLRAERERLRLSQDAFAKKCGVHRRTQGNYELDRRVPGADYWDAVDSAGGDSVFILSGTHSTIASDDHQTVALVLQRLLHALGHPPERFNVICSVAFDSEREKANASAADRGQEAQERLELMLRSLVDEGLATHAAVAAASEIDPKLLGEVLGAIERALPAAAGSLGDEKLGRLAVALYRTARALGKVDSKFVADAVGLVR